MTCPLAFALGYSTPLGDISWPYGVATLNHRCFAFPNRTTTSRVGQLAGPGRLRPRNIRYYTCRNLSYYETSTPHRVARLKLGTETLPIPIAVNCQIGGLSPLAWGARHLWQFTAPIRVNGHWFTISHRYSIPSSRSKSGSWCLSVPSTSPVVC
ncbi:hypothetical protein DAEQUDRAFT_308240 [Daedalea quercina L-15889]|uniref:Uncharacterized protein n=1 Tax=Daedalea quercina L-15889 TaxID=1314783 RepID=A0A165PXR5_9APHY|nr:hypothetical protein DAEQUDRAFT_308240 [Daedalea quercina L-15889]